MGKLDPALEDELGRVQAAGRGDVQIPIIIELEGGGEAPGGLEDLERDMRERQRGVVEHLEGLGARDVKQAVLANAVSARLRAADVPEIAGRGDVRLIRRDRQEGVTT